jgi:hypothetical protein
MAQPHVSVRKWYWDVGGQKHGPAPITELQARVHAKQIGPETPVWAEGMPEWMPAGNLPVLFSPSGRPAPRMDDDGIGLLMPVGPHSALSVVAGYCGLVGLLFAPAAPAGLVLGIYGLRDVMLHPEKRGRGRAITGIVLGSLMTLFWLCILVAWLMNRH